MTRFLADEDVYSELRRTLSGLGHDLVTVHDLGLKGTGDHAVLLRAARQTRVIITHNYDDFWLLHQAWFTWALTWGVSPPPDHAGILAVPQRDLLAAELTASAIENLSRHGTSFTNQLFRLQNNGEWINRSRIPGESA